MISETFVTILRCPKTQQKLELASEDALEKLNTIRQKNQLEPLDSALINKESNIGYPIINQIPVLLVDEAIEF